jgi:hypothetical protein
MPASLSVSAIRPLVKHPDESILFGVDFTPLLGADELLSAISGVSAAPLGLTLSSQAVNATSFPNDEGGTVAVNKGARFRATGGTAGTDYILTVSATTTAGNTRVVVCTLQLRDR